MNDTVMLRQGSCLRLECVFRDDNGDPENLAGDRFEIRDARPQSLATDLAIHLVEPEAGRIGLELEREGSRRLGHGRVNHFRLCRILASGCEDSTNLIWIEVA
jgi:hypothetical protein